MRTSEKIDQIMPALFKVRAELQAVLKASDNPFFKSKYASLNDHLDVVEPVLRKHGLELFQPVNRDTRGSYVSTEIRHSSGQLVASDMDLILVKNDMQSMGSAVTYARRYTLGSLLSMKAEDDDSEGAMGRGKTSNFQSRSSSNNSSTVSQDYNTDLDQALAQPATPERKTSSFRKPKVTASTESSEGWS